MTFKKDSTFFFSTSFKKNSLQKMSFKIIAFEARYHVFSNFEKKNNNSIKKCGKIDNQGF